MTRVDLHLHSRFSRGTERWWIRRAGIYSCYSDPRALYEELKRRGFDFFTLTDQHSIEGCLQLEGLPGVFNSEQVTALFPEDRVPVELLIWGLTEAQHRDVLVLRSSIYELQSYLTQYGIAHAVAHPFHHPEKRLRVCHVERLVLLFSHFESLHGMRSDVVNEFAYHFFAGLNPGHIEEMANRHGIAPAHSRAWEKVFVGGSGAEVGVFAGRAWTQAPPTDGVEGFLSNVKKGLCEPGGRSGGPVTAAHAFLQKAAFAALGPRGGVGESPRLPRVLSLFFDGKLTWNLSLGEKLKTAAEAVSWVALGTLFRPANAAFWGIVLSGTGRLAFLRRLKTRLEMLESCEDRALVMVSQLVDWCCLCFGQECVRRIALRDYVGALMDGASLIPALAPLAPYLLEQRQEAPRLDWMRKMSRTIYGKDLPPIEGRRVAWFTDTIADVNGVSMTICKLAAGGRAAGIDMVVLCSQRGTGPMGVPVFNFEPVSEFEFPEYERQRLAFPPVLEMIEYVQRERFTEIVLSTPGPVGLVGLLAARLLGLPVRGIYHTDFPRYARALTGDSGMEDFTWAYMEWFFAGLDGLYVNSAPYRDEWVERGVEPAKIKILPRGIDTTLFHPGKRNEAFWPDRGAASGALVVLYVGRVSKEKDLDMLPGLMNGLCGKNVVLAVVGDGPYLKELHKLMPKALFTGVLRGEALATAYASADVFVFPSTTDTYGNVVAEAHASGLPCVVSSAGGPASLVKDGVTGYVTGARDEKEFVSRVLALVESPSQLQDMRLNVLNQKFAKTWEEAALCMFGE